MRKIQPVLCKTAAFATRLRCAFFAATVGVAAGDSIAGIVPVVINAGTPNERTGVLVAQEGQCAVLTAAHEIDTRIAMSVSLEGDIHAATLTWNGLRSPAALDIALLKFTKPIDAECDPLASTERIEEAMNKTEGQVWLPGIGSTVKTPSVKITQRDKKTLTLSRSEADASAFAAGISGAAVVFDGLIVGILRENDARQFLATRLDLLLRLAGDEVRLRRFDTPVTVKPQPYDLSLLPAAIADEVRKARRVREEAEFVSKLALDVEKKATAAASRAEDEKKAGREELSSHKSFTTTSGDFYAGETDVRSAFFSSTTTTFPRGYGVLTTMSGEYKGEIKRCVWAGEDKGCVGPSVIVRTPLKGTWERYEADFSADGPKGPARVVLRSGVVFYASIQAKDNRDGSSSVSLSGSGVIEFDDGRRYEGELSGAGGDGRGAVWDAQGKLIRAGVWKEGKTIE